MKRQGHSQHHAAQQPEFLSVPVTANCSWTVKTSQNCRPVGKPELSCRAKQHSMPSSTFSRMPHSSRCCFHVGRHRQLDFDPEMIHRTDLRLDDRSAKFSAGSVRSNMASPSSVSAAPHRIPSGKPNRGWHVSHIEGKMRSHGALLSSDWEDTVTLPSLYRRRTPEKNAMPNWLFRFVWSVSYIWLYQTNQMNQRKRGSGEPRPYFMFTSSCGTLRAKA